MAAKQKHRWLRRLPMLIGVLLVIAVAVAIFFFRDLFQKAPSTKRIVQQITVVQPPPPPPPPPPPEQKPPEPEIKEEKIEEPKPEEPEPEPEQEPEPEPDAPEAPPGDQLGVEGDGGAGSDAFGLQARKGGRSLTEGSGGHHIGGTGGSVVHWYGGQIKRTLEEELHTLLADTHARKNSYMVVLSIWISPEGRLARAELSSSSGKADVDQAIREALPKLRLEMSKPPPQGMPQPVKIRVHSR